MRVVAESVGARHPAKFSDVVLERITEFLADWGRPQRVIDPFAGTGRVHRLALRYSVGVELEPEWAELDRKTLVANTLALPFPDATFDGLITSPSYGNRLADSHNARDGSVRHSYTHTLGRKLHPDNSGQLQWGPRYREFHDQAWKESLRVLQPQALIILNISNHIRNGKEQFVSEWHTNWFMEHGCVVSDFDVIATRRLREGANHSARVRYEHVIVFRYGGPTDDDQDG